MTLLIKGRTESSGSSSKTLTINGVYTIDGQSSIVEMKFTGEKAIEQITNALGTDLVGFGKHKSRKFTLVFE